MGTTHSDSNARRFPLRREHEPFRSRRLTSDSFRNGFLVEALTSDGARTRGHVVDVSATGVCFIETDRTEGSTSTTWKPGDELRIQLEYYGDELFAGLGRVRHLNTTDEGLRVGASLSPGTVNLAILHRTSDRLGFRHRWQRFHATARIAVPETDDFHAWLLGVRQYLESASEFLQAEERTTRQNDSVKAEASLEDFLRETSVDIADQLRCFRAELSRRLEPLSKDEQNARGAMLREQLGHLLFQCPLLLRAYRKPFGYAGDFELMNMFYRPTAEGAHLFAKSLNVFSKNDPGAHAVFNRLEYVGSLIQEAINRSRNQRVRIASIGCGSAREILDLLTKRPELGERLDVALMDQDPRALEHCERTLTPLASQTGAVFQFIGAPVQHLAQNRKPESLIGSRELIYSVGLFDYLQDGAFVQLGRAMLGCVAPGGQLVIGNMAEHNPSRYFIEQLTEWHLEYRSAGALRRLGEKLAPRGVALAVDAEPEGINLFLIAKHEQAP